MGTKLFLIAAVLFRYNIFSFVYLLLLLVNPLVPGPTYRNSNADGIKAPEALRLLGLDFVVLFVGTFSLVVCEKLATPEDTPRSSSGGVVGGGVRRRRHTIVLLLGEGLVLVLMAASGILYASLTSLAYFVCFLWSATTLGMHRPLGTLYRVMRTLLLIYSALHLMALYVYQLDYIQEFVPPSSLQARCLSSSPCSRL
ncbi:hypothetical protein HPB48_014975 [Haemaphysalis longicornis]|uniref:Piezo TM1-24 domain-containing protein n=1 Tax=Haemaphysalis longicornis TaxID=44386 RepID=A0A9J6FJG2_HAELO|nr:hypothetical protein HPB48_014975 [Haemaphysalis longicornis]